MLKSRILRLVGLTLFTACLMLALPGMCSRAEAADETAAVTSPISSVRILYSSEEIVVTSTSKVYYGTLKKDTDTTIKPSELVEASLDPNQANTYYIDISGTSASKVCYIGLAVTKTADSSGTVPVTNVKVSAYEKKLVYNIAWGMEGSSAAGYGIFNNIVITTFDGQTVTYDHSNANLTDAHKLLNSENLDIEYRKGSNCSWKKLSTLTSVQWDSMVKSGAIVYFRIAARDDTATVTGRRYSKETKVKIAVIKPSSVALDVSKLSLALKNGTQFRLASATASVNDWKTVLPYSASSSVTTAIRSSSLTGLFDPYTESTSAKVTTMSIDSVKTLLGVTGDAAFTIETRTAATTKKPAARPSTLTIPAQAGAPSTDLTYTSSGYKVGTITAATGDSDSAGYEYFICLQEDITNGIFDLTSIKWSSIKSGSVLKGTVGCKYTTTTGQRREVTLAGSGSVLLIRRKGTSGTSKVSAVLASKYIVLTVPAAVVTSVTPTGSVTATPTTAPTATPTTAPTATPTTAPTA